MPSLADHQSAEFTKLLLIGDSKSGKSGSLTSLVKAGYKLRILDFDNGIDILKTYVTAQCKDKIGNVEYRTLRDKYVSSPIGPVIQGQPKAFIEGLKMLDHWKYDTTDLGKPEAWGKDTILVIDSLTFMSDAAMAWANPMVPRSRDGKFDNRAVYGEAQKAIRSVLGQLTSADFRCNVIVTAHVRYTDLPDGSKKGYPTSAGEALNPEIPRYFNSVVLFKTIAGGKRTIQTVASALIDLGNPAPFKMLPELPIETGLADFFKTVRGE